MKVFGEKSYRRNFLAFLFHGVFLNIATAFSQLTTIQSSFIYLITGSSLLSGVLFAANRAGTILPQLFLAPIIEKRPYKKIFLLMAVSIRGVSWLAIAVVTYFFAESNPQVVAIVYFAVTLVFFLAGGMGDVTYYDILAKSIPTGARGRLSGAKILFGGVLSMAAGYLTKIILSRGNGFAENYALLFLLTSSALFIAFFGFYSLKEPKGKQKTSSQQISYKHRIKNLVRSDRNFMRFVFAEFFLNAGMILFPFYVIYAKEKLSMPLDIIGIFVTIQIVGELVSGPVLGWIGDRYNFKLVMIIVGVASFMAPLLALFLPLLHPYAYAVVFLFVGMTFKGVVTGTANYLMEFAPQDELPTYVAVKNTLQMPTIAFPVIGGLLIPFIGYEALFITVAVLSLVGTILTKNLICVRKIHGQLPVEY